MGSFTTSDGGRRPLSPRVKAEPVIDDKLAMLDVDNDLAWPRTGPMLEVVVDRTLPVVLPILSVRICLWYRVPVAAKESIGMSSFRCTVCACCRRLSSREKRREQ